LTPPSVLTQCPPPEEPVSRPGADEAFELRGVTLFEIVEDVERDLIGMRRLSRRSPVTDRSNWRRDAGGSAPLCRSCT
jgi:hypothetical protein